MLNELSITLELNKYIITKSNANNFGHFSGNTGLELL